MKSIRRTVLINLALLLLVTLGIVSALVYRTTRQAIVEKQKTATELVNLQYKEHTDERLYSRVQSLAENVQSQFHLSRLRPQSISTQLTMLAAPLGWYGYLGTGISLAQTSGTPFSWGLHIRLATEMKLRDEDIYRESDSPEHEVIQINSDWGVWPTAHLLPMDMEEMEHAPLFHYRFDTITLPNQHQARRVILKVPVTRFSQIGSFNQFRGPRPEETGPRPSRAILGLGGAARSLGPRSGTGPNGPPFRGPGGPGSGAPPGPGGPPPPSGGGNTVSNPLPTIYIQCAWYLDDRHPKIEELYDKQQQQLSDLDHETELTLENLRSRLAWTGLIALSLVVLGGWGLISLGLSPLKRISHAVSEISSKDFKIPIEPESLPAEIRPVVDRLSQTLKQLELAFDREKRAAADISHELRTPLAALRTTLEVATRKPRSAEQYKQTLDDCKIIAQQMSKLVERMLQLAWLDAGADQVHPEQVEIGPLVEGLAAIGKPLAEVQGLNFKVNPPPLGLTVHTDPGKLREVVMNLVHNAIEYTEPGGIVELKATPSDKGGVVVEVSDTGVGIPLEMQDKIFERFFRGDPSRTATGVHAGLGLAIVKEYVDRLGGRLTLESTLGKGSRFRVELPNAL